MDPVRQLLPQIWLQFLQLKITFQLLFSILIPKAVWKWFITRQEKLKSKNTIQFKTASLWGAQYEAKSLKEKSDLVIIDTPPKIDADGRPAIEVADLVLIPISPSQVDFWATESIIELAKREKRNSYIDKQSER